MTVYEYAKHLMAQTSTLRDYLAEQGMTPRQASMMIAIAESGKPLKMTALGEALDLAPATLTDAVDRAERKGFIARERPLSDRRTVLLHLTAKGTEALQALKAASF